MTSILPRDWRELVEGVKMMKGFLLHTTKKVILDAILLLYARDYIHTTQKRSESLMNFVSDSNCMKLSHQ